MALTEGFMQFVFRVDVGKRLLALLDTEHADMACTLVELHCSCEQLIGFRACCATIFGLQPEWIEGFMHS